jgi:GNAT superfamily N-acetyltransferase
MPPSAASEEPVGSSDGLRVAVPGDADAIDALMKVSIASLFPGFYDERQTASSIIHIGSVDRMLLEDGTYFVIDEGEEIIACGGWSRRDKLYTGSGEGAQDARILDPATEPARIRAMFVRGDRARRGLGTRILEACVAAARREGYTRLALMATLPGLPLYRQFGFRIDEAVEIPMPDGVTIGGAAMSRPIDLPIDEADVDATG